MLVMANSRTPGHPHRAPPPGFLFSWTQEFGVRQSDLPVGIGPTGTSHAGL